MVAWDIRKLKILEFVRFDSKIASLLLFLIYLVLYQVLKNTRWKFKSIIIAGRIYRHIRFDWSRRYVTEELNTFISRHGPQNLAINILSLCAPDSNTVARLKGTILNDIRPFDRRMIILSPPEGEARGVILIKFTEYFQYLPVMFDLDRLSKDYVLVLEPSSAGYFDENVLCLLGVNEPIIVQTPEPVDFEFLRSLNSNLIPIDLGANCWVDKEVFYPIHGREKTYDIIMVGIWANVKRYHHLFEAVSKRQEKHKLRIALVGTPWPMSLKDIQRMAQYYGVEPCIDFYENLTQKELNVLLNRSKFFLLLSKKEGFNKAIIEAMYANVPVALLEGHNFGHHYRFINLQTGLFISAAKLSEFIDRMDHILHTHHFSPREWISKHMSPESSVERLIDLLCTLKRERRMKINTKLQLKINNPDYDYVNKSLWDKYGIHYKRLQMYFRRCQMH